MWGRRRFRPAARRSARRFGRIGLIAVLLAGLAILACLIVVTLVLASKTSASSVEPSRAAPATAYVSGDLPARLPQRGQAHLSACVPACAEYCAAGRHAQAEAGWCPGPTPSPLPGMAPRTFLPLVMGLGEAPECAEPNDDPMHTCPAAGPGLRCGTLNLDVGQPGELDLADWYRLDASCAFTLTAQMDGPAGADFDLLVYDDPPAAPLVWGNSAGPDESVSLRLNPGRYYVVPTTVQGSGDYELRLGRQP